MTEKQVKKDLSLENRNFFLRTYCRDFMFRKQATVSVPSILLWMTNIENEHTILVGFEIL